MSNLPAEICASSALLNYYAPRNAQMKLYSILFFLSLNVLAEVPDSLVCENQGSVQFWPDSEKNKLDLSPGTPKNEERLYIHFDTSISESIYIDNTKEISERVTTLEETLTKITSHIYLAEGLDNGERYSGTFVFNTDFSVVSFSQDGTFSVFYKCKGLVDSLFNAIILPKLKNLSSDNK